MSALKVAVMGGASKATDLLAREMAVTPLERASASEPIGLVAAGTHAQQALAHVVAKPETVNALALIAPGALDGKLAATLAGVTIPVLALFGTRDASAQANGAAWRKALSNSNITFVYDTSADMANERPEAVASALGEFLRQRERYVVSDRSAKLFP